MPDQLDARPPPQRGRKSSRFDFGRSSLVAVSALTAGVSFGAAIFIVKKDLFRHGDLPVEAVIAALMLSCAALLFKARALKVRTSQRDQAGKALVESEGRLRMAQATARIATLDWDIVGGTGWWSSNFSDVFGVSGGAIGEGRPYEKFLALVHPDDRERVDALHLELLKGGGGPFRGEFRVIWPDGAVRWIAMRGEILCDANGHARRLVASNVDITDRRATEQRLRRNLGTMELANEAGAIGVWSIDMVRRRAFWDARARQIFDLPAEGEGADFAALRALIHPDDWERTRLEIVRGLKTGDKFAFECRIARSDGATAWVALSGRADREQASDFASTMTGIVQDVTESRRREAHILSVMRDISHRSNNLLAVVQSIARQASSPVSTAADFQAKFVDRIQGIAASYDLLVAADWRGASIDDVARSQIGPFFDVAGERVRISGPRLSLSPIAVQNIGMAFHELAANAAKYGALQGAEGKLALTWGLHDVAAQERRLRVTWRESGGSDVSPPRERGFGAAVTERLVAQALEGTAFTEFDPEGLTWTLEIPDRFVLE